MEKAPSWFTAQRLVGKVHEHICGHHTYGDLKTLFINTILRTPQIQHYSAAVVCDCISCRWSSTLPAKHCVFLPTLNLQFSKIVCLDHYKLESVTPLKSMYSTTRLSSAAAVEAML